MVPVMTVTARELVPGDVVLLADHTVTVSGVWPDTFADVDTPGMVSLTLVGDFHVYRAPATAAVSVERV